MCPCCNSSANQIRKWFAPLKSYSTLHVGREFITQHAHARAGGYVIGAGVHIYVYMLVDEKYIGIIL